ncbi:MAG: hypothetical protein WAV90_00195, partial [Gordonia amarae]
AVTGELARDIGRPADDPVVTLAAGAFVGLITAALEAGIGGVDAEATVGAAGRYAEAIMREAAG